MIRSSGVVEYRLAGTAVKIRLASCVIPVAPSQLALWRRRTRD